MRLANATARNVQTSKRTIPSQAYPIDSPRPHLRNGLLQNPCDRSDLVCLHRLHLHHRALNRGHPHSEFRRPNVIKSGFSQRASSFIHHPTRKSLRGVIDIRQEYGLHHAFTRGRRSFPIVMANMQWFSVWHTARVVGRYRPFRRMNLRYHIQSKHHPETRVPPS